MPPWGIALFYAFRLTAAAYLFFGVGYSPFDIHGWYEHAGRMLQGEVAGRDFMSPYGPLFNLFLLAAVKVWNNPFSMVVMFNAIELIGVCVMRLALLKRGLNEGCSSVIWLYMTCPFVFRSIGFNMQDEGILMTVLSILYYLYVRRMDWLIPVMAVIGIMATKVLAVVYVAPFFLMVNIKHSMRFCALLGGAFAGIACLGINPLSMKFERLSGSADAISQQITDGNPWYLLKWAFGLECHMTAQLFYMLAIAIVLLSLFVAVEQRCSKMNDRMLLAVLLSIGIISVSVNKMSYVYYLAPMLPFLFAVFVEKAEKSLELRLRICFVLLLWYGLTSPSVLFKVFGADLFKVANSVLFPVSAVAVWLMGVNGSGLKWPCPSRLVRMFNVRILGLDKAFDDIDQIEESRKI